MKNLLIKTCSKYYFITLFFLFAVLQFTANAQANTPLRRPVSPEQPMYLIHIDTWNYADPQKIIDLVPEDIRPYVVMNIALSISHDVASSRFQVAEYGYEIAKSWLTICAQNQMWAIVQHSSGGYAQFSDFDLSVYEEFYNDFPNLIGFNYAEQFWGFDDPNDALSPKWTDRINHLANMLEISNKYGGYLVVSMCWNQWGPSINPIGQLKRIPKFAAASEKYTENYLLFEKYTQQAYQLDMQSICQGAYLSGYSGNYGIRYDDTGWTDADGNHDNFTMATAGAVHLEHMMLAGATMLDGPELIWTQCFRETNRVSTTNDYMTRNWETFPQFKNVTVDIFRKILDGTIRIPTRQEVIDRTKFVVINDVNIGNDDDIYSSPESLFEGLYRMDNDGNLRNNKSFFKKTGRYPTIPTVFALNDEVANLFEYQINKSDYSSRWPTIGHKADEFNAVFPEEYTGDLYVGRHENGWVIYNPFKTGQDASASIPLKYNTSDHVELTFSQYTASVMKEYPDEVTFYLSNFDNELYTGRKTNVIKIFGSSNEPEFSYTDRGDHQGSIIYDDWTDGVYTLTIEHNGPLDVTLHCSGNATDRLTAYTQATLIEPVKPPVYTGPRQYEAECFDYKNIAGIITGGYNGAVRNYTGQGYLRVGVNSNAAVRKTVNALRKGTYQLITKYSVTGDDLSNLDLYVNGVKVATPIFTQTPTISNWGYNTQIVELNSGDNTIEFIANSSTTRILYLDNIVITKGVKSGVYHFENDIASNEATTPPAELITSISGSAGVVSYTGSDDITSNTFKAYSVGATNGTGVVDLEMFSSIADNYTVSWKEYHNSAGGIKGVLLRGTGDHGSSPYAEGMKQGYLFVSENNEDNTVTLRTYIADLSGISEKTAFTTDFEVVPGQPSWYRAKAIDNQLVFECSVDSINWIGAATTSFTDDTYVLGSTQLIWGMNSDNFDWMMDNIAYLSETVIVSRISLDGFRYNQGRGPTVSKSFEISGNSLSGDIEIYPPHSFELSLDPLGDFGESLILNQIDGSIAPHTIYVRMKQGLPVDMYFEEILILSGGIQVSSITVSGEVAPQSTSLKYNFTNDVATTNPSTPPALNTSIGQENSATAGVVSYTDGNSETSNMLKPYSIGQRNATGIIDLNLFPDNATDYSVTWKQYIGSASTEYKVGVLLRGDNENIGTESTGYVQGMMHGYLFIVYNTGSSSRFSVYRSTATFDNLAALNHTWNNSFVPAVGQPIWYRASASGTTSVSLILEYSVDGINWNIGASVTDQTPPTYTSGATQIVWGLAATAVDFYLDDILFEGLHLDSGTLPEFITVSESSLSGFYYRQENGPSEPQSFAVSGNDLTGDIIVHAPFYFEVSLEYEYGYASSIILPKNNEVVNETTVYVRLKSGLVPNFYNGEIIVSSIGSLSKFIAVEGVVMQATKIPKNPVSSASVVATEYYSITGQRLQRIDNLTGVFIMKQHLSDGSILINKVVRMK